MRKKNSLRLVTAVSAVTMLAAIMTGCSSDSASNRPANEIHILSFKDELTPLEEQIVESFNETSEVKVVLDSIASTQYTAKLRAVIDTEQAPDIFYNWGGGSIRDYVDQGLLMNLGDAITKYPELKADYLQSAFDAGKIDGEPYGIPNRGMAPVVLYYNSTLLASLDISVPETWDDLMAAVETLKEAGKIPIAVAGADPWTELMWIEYVYDRYAGPEFFDKLASGNGELWKSDESLAALKYIEDLLQAEAFGTSFGSVSYNSGGAPALFASGEAAFHLQGAWEYGSQVSSAPEFAKNDLAWTEFPAIPGGEGDPSNIVGNPTNYFSVLKATRYPDAVYKFLKQLSGAQFTDGLIKAGALPATKDAKEKLEQFPDPEFAEFEFNLVEQAPNFQLSWDQALKVSNQAPLYTNLQKLFAGQITSEQFADAMAALN